MGLVGSIGKAAGAVAKFCDDYNVAVRPRSSRTAGISNASVARANPKKQPTADAARLSRLQDWMHYAMIPAIIIVGMNTTPKPSLVQLLTPV